MTCCELSDDLIIFLIYLFFLCGGLGLVGFLAEKFGDKLQDWQKGRF